jgi:prophage regulatory protein
MPSNAKTDAARRDFPVLTTYPDLDSRFGIPYCRETIWRKRQRGEFPEPIQLGDNSIAWRTSDILAWIEAREREPHVGRRPAAALAARRGKVGEKAANSPLSLRSADLPTGEKGRGRVARANKPSAPRRNPTARASKIGPLVGQGTAPDSIASATA